MLRLSKTQGEHLWTYCSMEDNIKEARNLAAMFRGDVVTT